MEISVGAVREPPLQYYIGCVLLRRDSLDDLLHSYRAKLELGDFGYGVQCRIGEQVSGALSEVEGHEDHALGRTLGYLGFGCHLTPATVFLMPLNNLEAALGCP